MTAKEFAKKHNMELLAGDGEKDIKSVYCCDLLSIVMGRAPEDCGWATVMGNVNAVAVAVLAGVSCILLAEGMPLDAEALKRAQEQNVSVIGTSLPVYEAARLLGDDISEK